MSKSYIFIGAVILAVAGVGAFLSLSPKIQSHAVLNNGRQFDPATLEQMKKQDAEVLSLAPLGTSFSNVVAALGSDFRTSKTNKQATYFAEFRCTLPGMTNQAWVLTLIQSNAIVWTGYLHTGDWFWSSGPPLNLHFSND